MSGVDKTKTVFKYIFDLDISEDLLDQDMAMVFVMDKLDESGYKYIVESFNRFKEIFEHKEIEKRIDTNFFNNIVKNLFESYENEVSEFMIKIIKEESKYFKWFIDIVSIDGLIKLSEMYFDKNGYIDSYEYIMTLVEKLNNEQLCYIFNKDIIIRCMSRIYYKSMKKDSNVNNDELWINVCNVSSKIYERMNNKDVEEKIIKTFIDITNGFINNKKNLHDPFVIPSLSHNDSFQYYMIISKILFDCIDKREEKIVLSDIVNKKNPIKNFNSDEEKEELTGSTLYVGMIFGGFINIVTTLGDYCKLISDIISTEEVNRNRDKNKIKKLREIMMITKSFMKSTEYFCYFLDNAKNKYFNELDSDELSYEDINTELLIFATNVYNSWHNKINFEEIFFKILSEEIKTNIYSKYHALSFMVITIKENAEKIDENKIYILVKSCIENFENFNKLTGIDYYIGKNRCLTLLLSTHKINKKLTITTMDDIFYKNENNIGDKFILNLFDHVNSSSEHFTDLQRTEEPDNIFEKAKIKMNIISSIKNLNLIIKQAKFIINIKSENLRKILSKEELMSSIINTITHTMKEFIIINNGEIKHLTQKDYNVIQTFYNIIKNMLMILVNMRDINKLYEYLIEDELFSSKFFKIIYNIILNRSDLTEDENIMIGEFISYLTQEKDEYEKEKNSENYIDPELIPDDFKDPLTYIPIDKPVALPKNNKTDLDNIYIFDEKVIRRHILNSNNNPYTRESMTIEEFDEFNTHEEVKNKINKFVEDFTKWKNEYINHKN